VEFSKRLCHVVGVRETSDHLAQRIEQRRVELGYTPTSLRKATGLSLEGLKNLRKGKIRSYQERTTGPVTRAFGWTPDSIDRLLRGEEPQLVDSGSPIPLDDDVRRQVDELTQVVRTTLLLLKETLESDEQLRQVADALRSLDRAPRMRAQ
jgi:hypothetical protein